METQNGRLIIERMRGLEKAKNDVELAKILNVPQSTFSNWKNRNAVPLDVLIQCSIKHDVKLDWLVFGTESAVPQLAIDEQMILSAYRQLSQDKKLALMGMMSGLEQTTANGSAVGQNSRVVGGNDSSQNIYGNVNEVNGFNNK